ncbi:ParB/RepB/Spo0J family partition protein [Shimia sp. MIT910701]|uniref:ParB/RepB/Spo0J family partition protein n=1 Tax=Shimia sp. MIT910701 TaxID=3096987 RepID=UPI00399AF2F1
MTTGIETRTIPLDQLYVHPFNPRQDVDHNEIEALARSIQVGGVIHNLAGYADPTRDAIGIVDGGRRLRALQHLAHTDGAITEVEVKVTEDELTALSWAGAANVTHRPLHPADEIRAYRDQDRAGISRSQIASAFGCSQSHVRRRLKLAALPDRALDLLKANKINLDAAKALTVGNDSTLQKAVIDAIEQGEIRHVYQIREALNPKSVLSTDRRAVFVGLDAYQAEGGAITEDLFEENAYLHNEDLLNRLFAAKLETKTEQIRKDEGWSWATHIDDTYLPYDMHSCMDRLHPENVELPEADQADLTELESAYHWELSDEDREKLTNLRNRTRGDFDEADIAGGGVFVLVNGQGALCVERAFRKQNKEQKTTKSGTKGSGNSKPALPQNALDDLNRIALATQQAALIAKHELLLDILGWQIENGARAWKRPLGVTLDQPTLRPEKDSNCHIDARLEAVENEDWDAEFTLDALKAFQDKGKKHRNAIIAAGLARTLVPTTANKTGEVIAELAPPDIRKYWTPDADNYFGRLRADLLPAIWAELLDLEDNDERLAEFTKLKRKEKAAELGALFSDASVQEAHGLSRDQIARIDKWLPPEMATS